MYDPLNVQYSLNNLLVSLLESRNDASELEALRSMYMLLHNGGRLVGDVILKEFLDNLDSLLRLLCVRIMKSNLGTVVYHEYLKVIIILTRELAGNGYKDFRNVYFVLVESWIKLYCIDGGYETSSSSIEGRDSLLIDLVDLISVIYRHHEDIEHLNQLIYILLEVLKHTKNKKTINKVLDTLSFIPTSLDILSVYPGLLSRITAKLSNFSESTLKMAISLLELYITKTFDEHIPPSGGYVQLMGMHNTSGPHLNSNSSDGTSSTFSMEDPSELLIQKTSQLLEYLLKKYSSKPNLIGDLCLSCMKYEFIPDNVKLLLVRHILKASMDDYEPCDKIKEIGASYKLLLRDEVTRSITTVDEYSLDTYRAYLRIKDHVPCDVDFYISLKFLLSNVDVDVEELHEKSSYDYKFVIDDPQDVSLLSFDQESQTQTNDLILPNDSITKTATLYFNNLSYDTKIDCIYNILSFFGKLNYDSTSSYNSNFSRLLKLCYIFMHAYLNDCKVSPERIEDSNDSCKLETSTDVDYQSNTLSILVECRDLFINETLMKSISDDNVSKFRLLGLLRLIVNYSGMKSLSHDDIELILRYSIINYNSGYVRISQLSGILLLDLNEYFIKCGYIEDVNKSMGIRPILQYYTNKLMNYTIYTLNFSIIYTLVSFDNQNIDSKLLFDLVVSLCKAFDRGSDDNEQLLDIFYSFNHILVYIKRFYMNGNSNRITKVDNVKSKFSNVDDENDLEKGEGDVVAGIVTLIITRVRYHLTSNNNKIKYTSSLALYNSLDILSSNIYLFRIRVHEIWECLTQSIESNINLYSNIDILILLTTHAYDFLEQRLLSVLELVEDHVIKDGQIVTMADEVNRTLRYRYYIRLTLLLLILSKGVVNRVVFSKITLISLLISSPRACKSINDNVLKIFKNLSLKNPTLIRNLLLQISKGDMMDEAFVTYALRSNIKLSILKKRLTLSMAPLIDIK